MVVKRQCSFCAREIEPGTGMMFVKRDGTVYHFCTSSCRKQQLHLHRVGHRFKWTRAHELKRAADHASIQQKAQATPAEAAKASRVRGPRRTEPSVAAPPAPAVEPASPTATPAEEAPAKPESVAPAVPAEKKPRRPPRKKKADEPAPG